MELATFFEKFDQFAEAPNAVAKMRELVLQLAVRGHLTEHNANNESVSSEYADEPTSKVLPINWRLLNFGKFCDIQGGNQPPKSQFSSEPRSGYVRLFQIRDLGESPVPTYIPLETTNRFCHEGEILIGRYGASVGKIFWAQDGAYNVALAKFIFPVDALIPMFAYWALKSDFFQTKIAGASRSAQAGFNKGDLASIDFPLPPLAEQKLIVAKVDELMALCDRLEAQQQERTDRHAALASAALARFADAPTPANLNHLFHPAYAIVPADIRKAILTLAVQGKLVPQQVDDDGGSLLLEKINRERLAGVKARLVRPMNLLPPVADDELAFDVRPGWAVARLIELVMEIQTGPFGSSLHKSDYQIGGTPVINPASLKDGKIVAIDAMAIGDTILNRLEGFKLRAGDIVMARRGEMGRCAIVTEDEDGWLCGTGSLVLRMPRLSYAPYLAMLIGAPEAREYLGGASVGTTMQNLNQSILAKMPVGVPPLAEQRRIVVKVDQLMALVDRLESQLAASHAAAINLMDAVVAELTLEEGST